MNYKYKYNKYKNKYLNLKSTMNGGSTNVATNVAIRYPLNILLDAVKIGALEVQIIQNSHEQSEFIESFISCIIQLSNDIDKYFNLFTTLENYSNQEFIRKYLFIYGNPISAKNPHLDTVKAKMRIFKELTNTKKVITFNILNDIDNYDVMNWDPESDIISISITKINEIIVKDNYQIKIASLILHELTHMFIATGDYAYAPINEPERMAERVHGKPYNNPIYHWANNADHYKVLYQLMKIYE